MPRAFFHRPAILHSGGIFHRAPCVQLPVASKRPHPQMTALFKPLHRTFSVPTTEEKGLNVLPKLIFAECNWDPATARILGKLIPKLKELGYASYYEETDKHTTIDDLILSIDTKNELYKVYKEFFQSIGCDDSNPFELLKKVDVFILYKLLLDDELIKKVDRVLNTVSEGVEIVNRHSQRQYFKQLYKDLQKYNIDFKGIDNPSIPIETRDQLMAEAYSDSPVAFGRIGLLHVDGIQKNNLLKQDPSEAQQKYCFFNLVTDIENNAPFVKEIATGKQTFPLGLIQIDVKNKTDDEVIKIILKRIMEKTKKCEKIETAACTQRLGL